MNQINQFQTKKFDPKGQRTMTVQKDSFGRFMKFPQIDLSEKKALDDFLLDSSLKQQLQKTKDTEGTLLPTPEVQIKKTMPGQEQNQHKFVPQPKALVQDSNLTNVHMLPTLTMSCKDKQILENRKRFKEMRAPYEEQRKEYLTLSQSKQ